MIRIVKERGPHGWIWKLEIRLPVWWGRYRRQQVRKVKLEQVEQAK